MIITDLDFYKKSQTQTAIALGNFDGMHKGHQALLKLTVKRAKKNNLSPAILLFKTHTREAFNGIYRQIQSPADKIDVAKEFGIERVFLISFNESLFKLTGEEFVRNILINKANAKALISGSDYTFGRKKSGDVNLLKKLSEKYDFIFDIAPDIKYQDEMINSTEIRAAIEKGNLDYFLKLTGRYYRIKGIVGPGKQRGRLLGYPTANLKIPFPYCLPPDGVYYSHFNLGEKKMASITNIGVNPTFEGTKRKIEAHILDFRGNLYNKEISLDLIKFFRPDIRFNNKDELIQQIKTDEKLARKHMAKDNILMK